MRRGGLVWAIFGVWLLAFTASAQAATVRVGLFVGGNVGFGEDDRLAHAEREARDMAELFQDMGDLARERTEVLEAPTAVRLRGAMVRTEALVREASARGDDVLLVFYYSGHASKDGLHLAGTLFPMDELRRWLEGSAARVRVAFVDACESGTLARARGGKPVDTVDIRVDDQLTTSGLAVVTSTGPLSVARESDSFGGGVFSRALLSGLRGGADVDADGQITLEEAYRHAFEQTVLSTATGGEAIQRPEYRYDMAGVGSVVLTRLPQHAAGLILPEELEGVYSVVSVSTGQVVARVDKEPGELRRLALPTGRYVVRKVRREDVLLAELDLIWGGDRWIDDKQMSAVALGDALAKGGWSPRPFRVTAWGTGSTPPVQANPWAAGAELEGRWLARPTVGLATFVGWQQGRREEWMGHLNLQTARVGAGVFTEQHLQQFDLVAGGGVELVHFVQRVEYLELEEEEEPLDEELYDARQWAPGVWVHGGLHLPVGPRAGLDLGIRAHLYRAEVDHKTSILAEGQVLAGVSIRFGQKRMGRAGRRANR